MFKIFANYFAMLEVRSIVMSMFVCMSVFQSVCLLTCFKTTHLKFTKFPVHVNCGSGLVLLW